MSPQKNYLPLLNAEIFSALKNHFTVTFTYETILKNVYTKFLNKDFSIIDVGAHSGLHLKEFIKLVGESRRIIAIEPQPWLSSLLAKEYNHLGNIRVINAAIGQTPGKSKFVFVENAPEESGLKERIYNISDPHKKIIDVDVITLDSLTDDVSSPVYIKVDIEGGEIDLLLSGKKFIEKHRPLFSVEYGSPSYTAYGHQAETLYHWAEDSNYYIADMFGGVFYDIETWKTCCDKAYWDWFLIPKERIEWWIEINQTLQNNALISILNASLQLGLTTVAKNSSSFKASLVRFLKRLRTVARRLNG